MAKRSLYIVDTETWYTERAVWGIAGVVALAGTAASAWIHPLGVLLVAGVGMFSALNALTGFCAISTALLQLGLRPRISAEGRQPTVLGLPVYRMRTDRWYLERGIYLVVGVNLTLASGLTLVHSPLWLWFTGFVGIASLIFARTGFCPVANALYYLGFEPRLARLEQEGTDWAGAPDPC